MASTPYLIFSPSTLLSLFGLFRGPDKTVPPPVEDWRQAKVDVVIPAFNEERHIVRSLASLLNQTLKPRQIILIDDGSADQTIERAKAFCEHAGVEITAIRRKASIGKTPTIKRQARDYDSDVEFVLDGDTVLESENYIERTVQELYQAVGIASACGTILPQRRQDRLATDRIPEVQAFNEAHPLHSTTNGTSWFRDAAIGITNLYREVLYLFLQRVIYRGQMAFFGTISNPVGCAVAYRRKYVNEMFNHYTPKLGDDLTTSEDIFIGHAMLNEGYRNIQLNDVYARTVEPEVQRLPYQIHLWTSSFLQSLWYFDDLAKSPLKALKRRRRRRPAPTGASSGNPASPDPSADSGADRRRISEPYRQAFGRTRTRNYGRPAGWILFMGAVEKIGFPTGMAIMIILANWEGLFLSMAFDTLFCIVTLAYAMKGHRIEYALKALAVTPMRYAGLGVDLYSFVRFWFDLWLTPNRRWRK
jgi:glycosyltransferase involved in cell wall biosynthesis